MIKYKNTSTGSLGLKRKTMLSNEILIKSELGRPRPRGYNSNFKGSDVVYGLVARSNQSDDVSTALNWSSGNKINNNNKNNNNKNNNNYNNKINNNNINNNNNNNSSNNSNMDVSNKLCVKSGKTLKSKSAFSKYSTSEPNVNNPQVKTSNSSLMTTTTTTMQDLLEFKYQRDWMTKQLAGNRYKRSIIKEKSKTLDSFKPNKTVIFRMNTLLGRNDDDQKKVDSNWKMRKFQIVSAKIKSG